MWIWRDFSLNYAVFCYTDNITLDKMKSARESSWTSVLSANVNKEGKDLLDVDVGNKRSLTKLSIKAIKIK